MYGMVCKSLFSLKILPQVVKGHCVGVEVPDPQRKVPPANAALLLQRWYLQDSRSIGCAEIDANISSLAVMELTGDVF